MISRWIFAISGFKQDRSAECGIEQLWRTVLSPMSSATTAVQIQNWDDDFTALAKFVARNSTPDPDIVIAGYSWGGDAAVDFAQALYGEDLDVRAMVLGDPVYRSGIWPTWLRLNPLSMTDVPKLRIPPNVRSLWWCYQRNNKPAGHVPIATGPKTRIVGGLKIDCRHADIDECDEFRVAVTYAAANP